MNNQIEEFLDIYQVTSKIQGNDVEFRCIEGNALNGYYLRFFEKGLRSNSRKLVCSIYTNATSRSALVKISLNIDSQKETMKKLAEFYDKGAKDYLQMFTFMIHGQRQEYKLIFRKFEHYERFILLLTKLIEKNGNSEPLSGFDFKVI